jgi:hypothetical protein
METPPAPFVVKNCTFIPLSTGRHARNLPELSRHLREVEIGSIYQHFWGGRLRPQFDEPEYQNDFAGWVRRSLHDQALSERLGILDPTGYATLELLREEMVDIIEERLAQNDYLNWLQADGVFSFLRAQIVVFDTHLKLPDLKAIRNAIPTMPTGAIYYHFIDARRRPPYGSDDFSAWLSTFGDRFEPLRARLARVEPYFASLTELRDRLTTVFHDYPLD